MEIYIKIHMNETFWLVNVCEKSMLKFIWNFIRRSTERFGTDFHIESIWNLYGIDVDSIWILFGISNGNQYKIHMDIFSWEDMPCKFDSWKIIQVIDSLRLIYTWHCQFVYRSSPRVTTYWPVAVLSLSLRYVPMYRHWPIHGDTPTTPINKSTMSGVSVTVRVDHFNDFAIVKQLRRHALFLISRFSDKLN